MQGELTLEDIRPMFPAEGASFLNSVRALQAAHSYRKPEDEDAEEYPFLRFKFRSDADMKLRGASFAYFCCLMHNLLAGELNEAPYGPHDWQTAKWYFDEVTTKYTTSNHTTGDASLDFRFVFKDCCWEIWTDGGDWSSSIGIVANDLRNGSADESSTMDFDFLNPDLKAGDRVRGVEVVPYIERKEGVIQEQHLGPTAETTGYFVKLQLVIEPTKTITTAATYHTAMLVALEFARRYSVSIVHNQWLKGPQP